ncbi:hypothetical protein BDY17DRAFT_244589 [Neohortaea acidophila]|uniref:CID domain-containing protein n=1 Tax=Neohortaea acidophila TaxID=245834 RepID=A0A6A6Q842_9PEZI|nr:uncharacterized protein BDY17DRAFT_244589 [Neohortaea acidophila]KAF2487813.1 hypothetical protein BDY17DRAFT_244589 [Neohortaea acidophila]
MAEGDIPREFPDVNQKLAAPKMLSAFEKERQAAQAKEKREQAATAAALKKFEDDFGVDHDDRGRSRLQDSGFDGPSHDPRSGLTGGFGSMPGQPPPSMKRRRALDEMREAQEAEREYDMMDLDQSRSDPRHTSQPETHHDDNDDRVDDTPRPTIQLSSLPPTMSIDGVKALLKDHVRVHTVRLVAPPGLDESTSKGSINAIATLAADVPSAQINNAVSAITEQSRGQPSHSSLRNAPPPGDYAGFAPPASYDSYSGGAANNSDPPDATLTVQPPDSIDEVQAIHTVVDTLLGEPDPERALEIEAALMALPAVQQDEKFAFLYDSRSAGGIYYRFLLWTYEDPDDAAMIMKRRLCGPERVHEDLAIDWLPPYVQVPYPGLKGLEHVVHDADYFTSDEESEGDSGEERRFNMGKEGEGQNITEERKCLSPLKRAKLVHLLSRLPTSNARLRKGDVARVTNLAIKEAGNGGAEEIVDILLLNVEKPLSTSLAAKYEFSDVEQDDEDIYEPDENLSTLDSGLSQLTKEPKPQEDPSNAKLVALYIISDILYASTTAGVKNSWKYRTLFEAGFRHQKTFERLGKLDREYAWGRMKAEQWKRKILVLLDDIWKKQSVFTDEVQQELRLGFLEPPLSEEEKAVALAEAEKEEKRKRDAMLVEKADGGESPTVVASSEHANNGALHAAVDDTDGIAKDDGLADKRAQVQHNHQPLGGLDGAMDEKPTTAPHTHDIAATDVSSASGRSTGPRKRMRAEDMFVDSDVE